MLTTRSIAALLAVTAVPCGSGLSAQTTQPQPVSVFSYADYADLALPAPIVAGAQIVEAIRIKDAVAVPAGHARFYIEADVRTLLKGADGLPSRIRYLADVALDSANRPPKLRKAAVIVLAARVPGRPDEVQLVARDGQLPWTPDNEARIRAVLVAAAAAGAAPRVTGIGNAFYVPGAIPGESETQIFLTTDDGRPVSLNVLRRPGETPRWAVALGEMVDEAAGPPQRDTLLWYRLACSLPPALPPASTASLGAAEAAAAAADYHLVRGALGACTRTRGAV